MSIGANEIEDFLAAHGRMPTGASVSDGEMFGDWRVAAFLGKGGCGEVYRVVNDALDVAAALKVYVPRTGENASHDAAARARFLRETRFLVQNSHPAFPRFLGSGEWNGRPWYAMELLESCDLPSRDGDVAEFLLGVADGVGHLHSLGLVHRDIKPGNILWRVVGSHTLVGSRVPRDRMPVLTDLGLLKDTGTVPAGSTGGTLSVVDGRAVAVGTPRYAAPEQLNGGEITPLVDVYALGMLANECFGGRPSGAWARIVRRATAAIPAQRYSSVAHFVRAIRHRHLVRRLLVVCALLAASALLVLAFRGSGTHAASDRSAVRSRPFVTNGVLVLPGPGW